MDLVNIITTYKSPLSFQNHFGLLQSDSLILSCLEALDTLIRYFGELSKVLLEVLKWHNSTSPIHWIYLLLSRHAKTWQLMTDTGMLIIMGSVCFSRVARVPYLSIICTTRHKSTHLFNCFISSPVIKTSLKETVDFW